MPPQEASGLLNSFFCRGSTLHQKGAHDDFRAAFASTLQRFLAFRYSSLRCHNNEVPLVARLLRDRFTVPQFAS
jgi:hypothetical protein